jgi:hypothetical protein
MAGSASQAIYAFLWVICSICGFTYVLARVYLVAEALASFRRLLSAIYQTPNWSLLIPHI